MVKISLRGKCKHISLTPNNGEPSRCVIQLELDQNVSLLYKLYDVQLFVPAEFASLLEVNLPLTVTLEQGADEITPTHRKVSSSA